jgi:selenocysteine lyase/cysteine desulfurase
LTVLGIFYCRRSLLEELLPVHVGWGSLEKEMDEAYSTDSYAFEPARGARRYEEGAHNHVGIAALNAALDFIEGKCAQKPACFSGRHDLD